MPGPLAVVGEALVRRPHGEGARGQLAPARRPSEGAAAGVARRAGGRYAPAGSICRAWSTVSVCCASCSATISKTKPPASQRTGRGRRGRWPRAPPACARARRPGSGAPRPRRGSRRPRGARAGVSKASYTSSSSGWSAGWPPTAARQPQLLVRGDVAEVPERRAEERGGLAHQVLVRQRREEIQGPPAGRGEPLGEMGSAIVHATSIPHTPRDRRVRLLTPWGPSHEGVIGG